jgi:hypothetical protein
VWCVAFDQTGVCLLNAGVISGLCVSAECWCILVFVWYPLLVYGTELIRLLKCFFLFWEFIQYLAAFSVYYYRCALLQSLHGPLQSLPAALHKLILA